MLIQFIAPAHDAPLSDLERRSGGKRHRSVLLIGRVTGIEGAPVCLVHDISEGGLCARFERPPAVGDLLTVEVRGLPSITGTVRWVRGRKAGLQFTLAQDIERVFDLRGEDGITARPPRFPLSTAVQLQLDGRRIPGELLDLSAGGAKLALAAAGSLTGQAGAMRLPYIDAPIYGSVVWAREALIGFRFAAPMPLADLTSILTMPGSGTCGAVPG